MHLKSIKLLKVRVQLIRLTSLKHIMALRTIKKNNLNVLLCI